MFLSTIRKTFNISTLFHDIGIDLTCPPGRFPWHLLLLSVIWTDIIKRATEGSDILLCANA
jgi:hypothetical protein